MAKTPTKPTEDTPPSKKSPAKAGGSAKSSRKKKRVDHGYERHILKVLKQVHPDAGMSKKGMAVVNDMMHDLFGRIAKEASGMQ